MPIQTNVSIEIEGQKILKISRFVLEQKVNTHHKFAIVIPVSFEQMPTALEKTQSFVGGKVLVTATPSHFSTGETLQFRGIVSEAKLMKGDGSSAVILVNGFSTTFQMEGLPDTISFNEKKLSEIAQEIISRYPQDRLEPKINLENDDSMLYTVQYMESDFRFLSRMASKKAVWFYYNGRELIFGKPESKTINLTYGSGLSSFNFEMRTKPMKFSYYGYDSSEAMNEMVTSDEVTPSLNTISESLFQNSKRMFPSTANVLYNNPIKEGELKNHLSTRIKSQTLAQTSDLLTVSGSSDNPSIRIGDIVNINDPGFSVNSIDQGVNVPKNYGSFYVTDIMHTCDEAGNYFNEFQGISSDAECPPYGNVHNIANAETQSGIVMDNNDPKGQSRITVQFPWQKRNGSVTPWLRVTTPYAGEGKGFHVLPEIGEEVLVEFEGGNPEKPVVIGAMFHGKGKSGHGGAGNFMKGIQTPTGNKLQLNDKDGSVFLSDQGGANMKFDGAGNATTNANSNHTVNAGSTNIINVGGEKNAPPQSLLKMDKDGNILLDGKTKITFQVGGNKIEISKEGVVITAEEGKIDGVAKAGPVTIKSESAEATFEGTTMTTLKGADVAVNGNSTIRVNSADTDIT